VSGTALALDHVGVVVRDVAAARRTWEAAGFAPTPGGRIMLRQGYLELLAQDAAKPSATLAAMLALGGAGGGEGAHVLSLRVADAQAAAARLARAGFATEVLENSRPGEAGGAARFRRVPLTDALPRLQLIEHATPETVWHPALLDQPNGALALAEVVAVADPPAVFAARLSHFAGRGLVPADGGFLLALAEGAVRVLGPDGFRHLWPGAALPAHLPRLAALILRGTTAVSVQFPGLELRILGPGTQAPG
jgi:hypothetical protein